MAPFNDGQRCRETRKYHLSCSAGYSGITVYLSSGARQAAGRHSLQSGSAWIRKPTLIVIAVADLLGTVPVVLLGHGWWLIVIVALMVLLHRQYQ